MNPFELVWVVFWCVLLVGLGYKLWAALGAIREIRDAVRAMAVELKNLRAEVHAQKEIKSGTEQPHG